MADEMITIPSYCMVTIRRPNGHIETLNYTEATKGKVRTMSPRVLEIVNKLMADAKRGEIISYENFEKEVVAPQPSAADLAEERYIREYNAIMRASAGGEPCDQIRGIADDDNTPQYKQDY
jgi:hypothetical protein